VGPVLLLAFTNHALDHILHAVHDAGITENIARLGSRSKDEVVSQYTLDNIRRSRGKNVYTRALQELRDERSGIENVSQAHRPC
jgi:hypothetical protein